MKPIKNAKDHVDEGLDKVRSQPWANPLSKSLGLGGFLVGTLGSALIPGAPLLAAPILGGALGYGSTMLKQSEPSTQELQDQLGEIKAAILKSSKNETAATVQEQDQVQLEQEGTQKDKQEDTQKGTQKATQKDTQKDTQEKTNKTEKVKSVSDKSIASAA